MFIVDNVEYGEDFVLADILIGKETIRYVVDVNFKFVRIYIVTFGKVKITLEYPLGIMKDLLEEAEDYIKYLQKEYRKGAVTPEQVFHWLRDFCDKVGNRYQISFIPRF